MSKSHWMQDALVKGFDLGNVVVMSWVDLCGG